MSKSVSESAIESCVILFLDENLSGKIIPAALSEAGIAHETHSSLPSGHP